MTDEPTFFDHLEGHLMGRRRELAEALERAEATRRVWSIALEAQDALRPRRPLDGSELLDHVRRLGEEARAEFRVAWLRAFGDEISSDVGLALQAIDAERDP